MTTWVRTIAVAVTSRVDQSRNHLGQGSPVVRVEDRGGQQVVGPQEHEQEQRGQDIGDGGQRERPRESWRARSGRQVSGDTDEVRSRHGAHRRGDQDGADGAAAAGGVREVRICYTRRIVTLKFDSAVKGRRSQVAKRCSTLSPTVNRSASKRSIA